MTSIPGRALPRSSILWPLSTRPRGAGTLSLGAARVAEELLTEMTELFGFVREEEVDTELVAWIEEMIAARAAAKKEKNYAEADRIRALLSERGVTLRDTAKGTTYTIEK